MSDRLVSIIINNYNYARFLRDAIDSALDQSHQPVEVIVVDDGSTDNSAEVIAGYGSRVVPVIKENEGQTSAFNVGFRISRGEVVIFLDSDDMLLPTAAERAQEIMRDRAVAKVHWPLWVVDREGTKTGQLKPESRLVEGDLKESVVDEGPEAYVTPPTSGNAWARAFLEKVFPLPEIEGYRRGGADVYLAALAPLFGSIRRISEPQSYYRLHEQNNFATLSFEAKFKQSVWCYDDRCSVLAEVCRGLGIQVDPDAWKRKSWLYRFPVARDEIARLVPPGEPFILVDDQALGEEVAAGRQPIPFLERDGEYWGAPPDDETAIEELNRLREGGARFIVFAWPAFWWLGYYKAFEAYLRSNFECPLENERLIAFDLRAA